MVTGSRVIVQFGGSSSVTASENQNTIGINNSVATYANNEVLSLRNTTQVSPPSVQYIKTVTPGTNTFEWFSWQIASGQANWLWFNMTITALV
jgi:hypothetical protein